MSDAAILVRGLRKVYVDTAAVDGIDLALRRGAIFALLRTNGAGRTTTVAILEGYRRLSAPLVSAGFRCGPAQYV